MRKRNYHRKKHIGSIFIIMLVLIIAAYGYFSYKTPLPVLAAQTSLESEESTTISNMPWPKYGASAIGAVGYGVLATNGNDKQIPTASVAKTLTALAVLQRRPLKLGDLGPNLTLTKTDVAYYDKFFNVGGSLVPVKAGEKITEYQALEAMMLPSANNMAETLADWAFGTQKNYVQVANKYAQTLGMTNTRVNDASGFDPKTASTAHDLVLLGIAAEKNPVLAQIVSHKAVKIPVAGTIKNVNWLLNYPPFDGIKTGSTDQDGGAILFSEQKTYPNGQTITIVGVIMGAKLLSKALNDAFPLAHAAEQNFKSETVISKGQKVGYYNVPWGSKVDIIANESLKLLSWKGQDIKPKIEFKRVHAPLEKGTPAGKVTTIELPDKTITLVTNHSATTPSWYWRALRNL